MFTTLTHSTERDQPLASKGPLNAPYPQHNLSPDRAQTTPTPRSAQTRRDCPRSIGVLKSRRGDQPSALRLRLEERGVPNPVGGQSRHPICYFIAAAQEATPPSRRPDPPRSPWRSHGGIRSPTRERWRIPVLRGTTLWFDPHSREPPQHRRYCPRSARCLPEGSPLSRRRHKPPSGSSWFFLAGGCRRGTLLPPRISSRAKMNLHRSTTPRAHYCSPQPKTITTPENPTRPHQNHLLPFS
jgi:hypothetical protein